jgi:MinD-like ATPase involved in chromosome partitioning or flagellar assembly
VSIPTLYIVGADKGGVGKTTLTRLLLDYFRSTGVAFKAYDTESPSGALQRFFPDQTEIVDLTKSSAQMKVFDNIGGAQATVIDIRAGLLAKTLATLIEIGFLEAARKNQLRIVVLHVIGPATQSLDEVEPVLKMLQGAARHIVVANHINDTEYAVPKGALVITKLDETACGQVDKAALPYTDFVKSTAIMIDNQMQQTSFVLRGKVRNWTALAFEAFDNEKLNESPSLI